MAHVFCTSCGTGISVDDEYCRSCGRQQAGAPAVFHPMSPAKLAMLYVGTLGLYCFVWFWLQWRACPRREGETIWPVSRAIFFPVTSHALVEAVAAAQSDRNAMRPFGNPRPIPARSLAVLLMVFVWAVPLLAPMPWKLFWLAGFLPLLPAQRAINGLNPGRYHYTRNSRIRPRLALPMLPGAALIVYLAASFTGLVPPAEVLAGRTLSARQYAMVQHLAGLEAGETIEYYYSAARLFYADDGNVVTDRRLVSYFRDADGFLSLDSVEYGRIRSVHVIFGDFFTPTSIVACVGSSDPLILYSSGGFDGDERMISAIRDRLRPDTPVMAEADGNFACAQDISA